MYFLEIGSLVHARHIQKYQTWDNKTIHMGAGTSCVKFVSILNKTDG
jgi:hypothetical protein